MSDDSYGFSDDEPKMFESKHKKGPKMFESKTKKQPKCPKGHKCNFTKHSGDKTELKKKLENFDFATLRRMI